MKELPLASPSAVAVLESPARFLLEERPNLPGMLAYPGRILLFGGHIDAGERPIETICRELWEELTLTVAVNVPRLLWNGMIEDQFQDGSPALRDVSVFHISLDDEAKPCMNIPGRIVSIDKTEEAVMAHKGHLPSIFL